MPQVPYQPFPNVAPSAPGTPMLREDTPGTAFGTTIARAIEGLGGTIEKDGGEIFQRAIALQDLQNRTDADKANTDYITAVGQKEAQFRTLEGRAAVAAEPQFRQDLAALRDQFGANLNPMARKLYDTESRNQMARNIINGAIHAGEQNKVYQIGTAEAGMKANRDAAFASPNNNAAFQASWDAVEKHAAAIAGLKGWDDVQTQQYIFQQRSALLADNLKGLSRTNPLLAEQKLNAARDNNTMDPKDWESTYQVVHHEVVTTGARVASQKINLGLDPRMDAGAVSRFQTLQTPLQRIIARMQQDDQSIRFTIPPHGGARTQAEQDQLVLEGRSKTRDSTHLLGLGVDLVPVGPNGQPNWNDKAGFAKIEENFYRAAEELGIPVSDEHEKIKSWDPGHFSLPRNTPLTTDRPPLEETLQSRVARGQKFAQEQFPDDGDFQTVMENNIRQRFNADLAAKRDLDFRNLTTVGNALLGAGGTKVPTTIDELRAISPDVREAYDNLGVAAKNRVLNALTRNSKGDFPTNEANFQTFQRLRGEAETAPQKFLEEDIMGVELPRAWRSELYKLQLAKSKNADTDPRVTHAIGILQPMLQPANISRTADPDRYAQFVGALQDELKAFQDQNKRPPKAQEINEIGAQLLQEQHTSWYQVGSQRMFEIPVPQKEYDIIAKDPKWSELGVQPTEELIHRVWIAKKYQELYNRPTTSGGTAP